ncbi:glycoside hydrolase domain-containing protein [Phycisphaerales bacterium AB-hyl4]|uniref:Glycoside hydrolase domain-containing protein n=1 Tax=Natronomicrosphaera hydrolytica TaxID=3242702 RepID=A0ABV4U395_9BACT
MRSKFTLASLGLTLLAPVATLQAEIGQTLLYDFETAWQIEDWEVQDASVQSVYQAERFATSGQYSAGFRAAASDRPPHFRLPVWDNHWAPYNRIAMELTNPTDREIRLETSIVGELQNGYHFMIKLPPMSHTTVVQEFKLPSFIRHDNIHALIFRPQSNVDVNFYLDDVRLLTASDDAPAGGAATVAEELREARRALARDKAASLQEQITVRELDLPEAEQMMRDQVNALLAEAERDDITVDEQVDVVEQLNRVGMTLDRFVEIREYVDAYAKDTSAGFVVGFADSMRKIMPKHHRSGLAIDEGVAVSLAGGEHEAFQVAVAPFRADAKNVTVRVSDLTGPDGAVISKDQIDTDIVAFAKTTFPTDDFVDYVGWWPEALVASDRPIDVALGDVQTWWVRIRAPRDQSAGTYTGTITLAADGQEDLTFDLATQVYGFNVPRHAPIPTAITYISRDVVNHAAIGSREKWEEIKFEHTDVLNDYYINMDSIYNWANPDRVDAVDWDIIEYQREKGTLVSFNITHYHGASDQDIENIRPYYEEAKRRGLLEHAYIYGWDETPPYSWQGIEDSSKRLSEAFPEVLTMVTSQDHSYGFNSPIKSLGAWCPIISRYNPDLADKAREEGRQVWWYTCIWPPRPYPNIFVDYPAIDNRVMTGLMHMKYQPDGWLYYHTSIWHDEKGLHEYPYSNWNPEAHMNTNGDGAYFVLGADGTLIPTIRIENYRDGFEDLAYYMILEHQVRQYDKQQSEVDSAWLSEARSALDEVNQHVRSRVDWTEDPQAVYAYRQRLATLIEASPIDDTDPWKDGMGVRGLLRD